LYPIAVPSRLPFAFYRLVFKLPSVLFTRYQNMQTTLALAALVAGVAAQGVTQTITPTTSAPAGCSPDFTGDFEITAVNSTIVTARSLVKVCPLT